MSMTPAAAEQALVTGSTKLLSIVGDPITQVRSPVVYNPRIVVAGVNAILIPVHIQADCFELGMQGLMSIANLGGIIITTPFKERALGLVRGVGPIARQVGALNALRREADGSWTGEMFDGAGLVAALRGLGQTAAGRRVVLIGAGGAGRAIAMALAAAGAASLHIHDRDAARARKLAADVAKFYPACGTSAGAPRLDDHNLFINATPAGLAPDFALVSFEGALGPGITVIDIVPTPERTKLLAAAEASGCPTVNGQAMIAGQADAVLAFFGIGRDPASR